MENDSDRDTGLIVDDKFHLTRRRMMQITLAAGGLAGMGAASSPCTPLQRRAPYRQGIFLSRCR